MTSALKKKLTIVGTVAASLLVHNSLAISNLYTNSYADCLTFASQFGNTCNQPGDGDAGDTVEDLPFSTERCNYAGICPDGSVGQSQCTWYRKLCVTCEEETTVVANQRISRAMIRVQTNSMPDHCYMANTNPPKEYMIDFTVAWNPYAVPIDTNEYS